MQSLTELIESNGWRDIAHITISREGHNVDTSKDIWHLPYTSVTHASIDFKKIENSIIRWVTKRFIQEEIEITSTHSGYSYFNDIHREVYLYQSTSELTESKNENEVRVALIKLFENALSEARSNMRLWAMYRPIQWYIWGAENYPELGFCPEYSIELAAIRVPGNPKGEAVRSNDLNDGPFHRTLEFPLIIDALKNDTSTVFDHLQQKAALALCIAFGRNPANLTYLKEIDLVNVTPSHEKPTWVINMPRIKKRFLSPRDDFKQEYLDPFFANLILDLIEANKLIKTEVNLDGKTYEIEKPLFINRQGNKAAILSKMTHSTFNMTSEGMSKLLQDFIKRHRIISPLTNTLLKVSTRRFRYTLGTELAAQGVSKKELARILDHTDTQHVLVYFELASRIVEHLDKAAAKGFSKVMNLFKGTFISSEDRLSEGNEDKQILFVDQTLNPKIIDIGVCGKKTICHLDPPYSCYLCAKFMADENADHEYVLEKLLETREERLKLYEGARIGVQLDDVIFAVAAVANKQQEGEG